MNLLNADDGNIRSPLLKLFATKKTVDEQIIEIYDDDMPNLSGRGHEDVFFDCDL